MKKERLLELLNNIDEDLITRAEQAKPKRRKTLNRWAQLGLVAACFVVLFAGGVTWYSLARVVREVDVAMSTDEMEPQPASIWFDGLLAMREAREMAVCTDEEELQYYLWHLDMGGKDVSGREDLVSFLELMDSLPYLPILEREPTYVENTIHFQYWPELRTAEIVTTAGSWDCVQLKYLLSPSQDASHGEPIAQSEDGRVKVYNEEREKHPTNAESPIPGNLIRWEVEADGFCVLVEYYTIDLDRVVTEDVFANLTVRSIPRLE